MQSASDRGSETMRTGYEYLMSCRHVTRCGPSHLCDGWSGCVVGGTLVKVITPYGTVMTRLEECLRPGQRFAQVYVYNPDNPQHADAAVYVPAEMVHVPSNA